MSHIRGAGLPLTTSLPIVKPIAERVDASSLDSTKGTALVPQQDTRDPRVLKAAQMYESQFLRYMLAEMRKTVPESEFMAPNQAEKIFKDQLDDQYVDSWVEKGGVGMSDMIYQQIMERFAPHIGGQNRAAQQSAPQLPHLPLHADKIKSTPGPKTLQYEFHPLDQGDSPHEIVSPWDCKVTESRVVDRQSLLRLQHPNGLDSLLQFEGWTSKQPGDLIAGGEKLGELHNSAQSLLWRVNRPPLREA